MIDYKRLIRTIPDHPKPGILFRDITTLLGDPVGFRAAVADLVDRYREQEVAMVAGIEARGFILGGAMAERLGAGFLPIRKKGKLPFETIGHDYELEYGTDRVEIHRDAVSAGQRVLLVDDLIATGGTAVAGLTLLRKLGAQVLEACFIIELPELGGRRRLQDAGCPVHTLISYEGH